MFSSIFASCVSDKAFWLSWIFLWKPSNLVSNNEYVSNPLAEDSNDEKKIYKAQIRAESKLKKEKAKRNGRTDQKITPYDCTKKHTTTGTQFL
jgi:hypothetical protein